ncbi:MAG: hypothetical protein FMNOHCHN_01698 [Ignavibacteriaceae bacterium]|nr:hypothetical protein [Ignavibacteriaceae bacterium]
MSSMLIPHRRKKLYGAELASAGDWGKRQVILLISQLIVFICRGISVKSCKLLIHSYFIIHTSYEVFPRWQK